MKGAAVVPIVEQYIQFKVRAAKILHHGFLKDGALLFELLNRGMTADSVRQLVGIRIFRKHYVDIRAVQLVGLPVVGRVNPQRQHRRKVQNEGRNQKNESEGKNLLFVLLEEIMREMDDLFHNLLLLSGCIFSCMEKLPVHFGEEGVQLSGAFGVVRGVFS